MAWSPDGKLLAESGSNVVVVMEPLSGRPLFITPFATGGMAEALAWSPDGRMIAVGFDYDEVVVFDGTTGKLLHRLSGLEAGAGLGASLATPTPLGVVPPNAPVASLSWSPDSSWLAAAAAFPFGNPSEYRGEVRLWSITTGTLARTLSLAGLGPYTQDPARPIAATRVAWSPDGSTLASISDRDVLAVWDPFTGSELRSLQEGAFHEKSYRPLDFRWSPDGRTIAVFTQYSVELWDPFSGSMLHSLPGQPPTLTPTDGSEAGRYGTLLGAAWSPQGDRIATFDDDEVGGAVRVWDVITGKQLHSRQVETPRRNALPLAWSPDGRVLAFAGASLELWDAQSNKKLRDLGTPAPQAFAWSPDGSMLFVYYAEGKLEIWGDPAHVAATPTATIRAP
jgi:WD40 repeat protein